MFLVFRALDDPAFEQIFLPIGERLVRLGRRHDFRFIIGENPCDQIAFLWLARNEGPRLDGCITDIQAQVLLTVLFIRAVAVVAIFRKDGPDIAVEADLFRRRIARGNE